MKGAPAKAKTFAEVAGVRLRAGAAAARAGAGPERRSVLRAGQQHLSVRLPHLDARDRSRDRRADAAASWSPWTTPGNLINPLIVEGQIHGGLAQGIGQAMIEEAVYNDDGQLLTGSFMDYAMPRATDFPRFELHGDRDADAGAIRSAPRASARPARSARRRASCRRRSTR